MCKQKNPFKKLSWPYALLLTVVLACTDDNKVNPDSPAYHIAKSEKINIPSEVDLPDDLYNASTRVATYYAKGIQIYKAQQVAGSDPVAYEWVFVAPSAELYDEKNREVGVHFAGPTWQLLSDDSKINAQQFSPARTKSVDPNSISWLLLMPKEGAVATGIFQDVAFIQRIATTGGKAPSTPPTGAIGEIGVAYTAVYRFTKISQ